MHISLLEKLKNRLRAKTQKKERRDDPNLTRDQIDINLLGLGLSVTRETNLEAPSELSVILPRVEYRRTCTPGNPPVCSSEIIYNSLTVVISPRHPLAGPTPAGTTPGERQQSF
jgi:hypothetical protein